MWLVFKVISPRMVAEFGEGRFRKIERAFSEKGRYVEPLLTGRMTQLIARCIVWGGRRRIYLPLDRISPTLRVLSWLSVICELGFLGLFIAGWVQSIRGTDLEAATPQVMLSVDRLIVAVQQFCGSTCPRSTLSRALLFVFLASLAVWEICPNPRFKWVPKEGRYVRRW